MVTFNMSGCTIGKVGTLLSAAKGSTLRVFMECKECHAHSKLPQDSGIKCPKCGATDAEQLAIANDAPAWFRADSKKATDAS